MLVKFGNHKNKSYVPNTFQLAAIWPFLAFLASRKINKLCVFNTLNIPTPPASTNYFCTFNSLQEEKARVHFAADCRCRRRNWLTA